MAPVEQTAQRADDEREWRSELVRHVREEARLRAIGLGEPNVLQLELLLALAQRRRALGDDQFELFGSLPDASRVEDGASSGSTQQQDDRADAECQCLPRLVRQRERERAA